MVPTNPSVRTVDEGDVGKPVVTSWGLRIGAVLAVFGRDAIVVDVDRVMLPLVERYHTQISGGSLRLFLQAEDVEMVTDEKVWLRSI